MRKLKKNNQQPTRAVERPLGTNGEKNENLRNLQKNNFRRRGVRGRQTRKRLLRMRRGRGFESERGKARNSNHAWRIRGSLEPLPMVRQPFPGKRTSGGARPRIPLRTLHFRHQFPGRRSMAEKLTGIFRKPPAHRAAFFA